MNDTNLVFYDTSSIYCSGYYLEGFNELKSGRRKGIRVSNSLDSRLKAAMEDPDWQHLLFAMVVFRLSKGSKEWFFCIDTHDSSSVNRTGRPDGYHLPLLRSVDAYFKVNYNPQMIENSSELSPYRERIHGVAQFFPVLPAMRISLLRRLLLPPVLFGLKPSVAHDRPYSGILSDARRRQQELRNLLPFEKIIVHRNAPKDIDIFFVTSYYGKERHEKNMETRYRIMKRLLAVSDLRVVAGFTSFQKLPEKYRDVHHQRLGRGEYVRMLARSKVVIYTQGMEGCISSKFSLAMALGIAVIGEPLVNNPELMIKYPHLSMQFAWIDPEEITEHAIELARDPGKAGKLGALNATLFDNQIAPRIAAQSIVDTLTANTRTPAR